jgi:hypothetical protein
MSTILLLVWSQWHTLFLFRKIDASAKFQLEIYVCLCVFCVCPLQHDDKQQTTKQGQCMAIQLAAGHSIFQRAGAQKTDHECFDCKIIVKQKGKNRLRW